MNYIKNKRYFTGLLAYSATTASDQVIGNMPPIKIIEAIKFTYFNSSDVIRHPLVQKIIHAYEEYAAD